MTTQHAPHSSTAQGRPGEPEPQPSGRVIDKHSPVTGAPLGTFPIGTEDDVRAAVARARAAFPAWRDLGVVARLERLRRLGPVIAARGEELAQRISEDTGKPLVESLMTELMSIPLFVEYYRKEAPKVLRRQKVPTSPLFLPRRSYVEHYPRGVVGVISPWNFPFQLAMVPAISALIGGNTVVIKPSEVTPITGEIIREVFDAIGLPDGVVEVVQGDGSTGAALTAADIDMIFFTGSVATGRKVMAAAAEKPIPCELELGGKDALIVCHDAPLERAAKAAVWGGLLNCGQMCTSVERIFVVDAVYDEFLALLKREMAKVKVGAPDEDADMGPMTFPKQIDTVERHLAAARDAGAEVLVGGRRLDERPGQFFAPTLVTGVTPEMEIYREETFGPVLPVVRVRDEDEAVRLASDHQYGLTGSVWTRDTERGLRLASRVEAGQVNVNDLVLSVGNPALPFGGVKNSGIGRYHGAEGLLSFVHTKAIMVDPAWFQSEPFWYPYAPKMEGMTKLFHSLLDNNLVKATLDVIRIRRAGAKGDVRRSGSSS